METNLRNITKITIPEYGSLPSNKQTDIHPSQNILLYETSSRKQRETSEEQHIESIEDAIVGTELLDKLPETFMQILPSAIDTIAKSCIEPVIKAVSNVARLPWVKHINELRELTNTIQNNHSNWSQSRILSELRRVNDGSEDDMLVKIAMSLNSDSSRMTVDEQNYFRRIRNSLIKKGGLDIGRVIATMDVRQHFNSLIASNSFRSDNFETIIKAASISSKSIHSKTYDLTKAELLGKIDGSNIANHMEKGYEMDALFNYYLGNGQHCDGITINARFTNFKADLHMVGERWAASKISEEYINSIFNENNSQESKENQDEEESKNSDYLSVLKNSDLIEISANKNINPRL